MFSETPNEGLIAYANNAWRTLVLSSATSQTRRKRGRLRRHTAEDTTMLLSFIIARLRAKPAYVWKPDVTMTDSRIVSELTGAAN